MLEVAKFNAFTGRTSKGYAAGKHTYHNKLVSRIDTKIDGQEYRSFFLDYEGSDFIEERVMLTSVQECSDSAKSSCLPATSFEWNRPPLSSSGKSWVCDSEIGAPTFCRWQATQSDYEPFDGYRTLVSGTSNRDYTHVFDINGDGYSDVIYYGPAGYANGYPYSTWVARLGPDYDAVESLLSTKGANKKQYALNIDYNGDGHRDLLVADSSTSNWTVLSFEEDNRYGDLCDNNGPCSDYIKVTSPKATDLGVIATGLEGNAQVMDIDGDGYEDIVFRTGSQIKAHINTGSGSFTPNVLLYSFLKTVTASTMNGHYESQTANMQSSSVIDVNGDGRSDLIMKVTESDAACYDGSRIVPMIRSKWECERDIGGVWVEATNTYHKLFIASGTSSSPSLTLIQSLGLGMDTLRVADINGDGLSDLLYVQSNKWYYRLSDGVTLLDPVYAGMATSDTLKYLDQFVDLNGDGRTDVLHATVSGNYYSYFSRATSNGEWIDFEPRGEFEFPLNATVRFGDTRGDGNLNLLASWGDSWREYYRRPGTKEYSINKIVNGFGVETKISYKPLSDNSVYVVQGSDDSVNKDGISPVFGMQVVSEVASQSNTNQWVSVSYQYGGMLIHRKGRGSLGFEMLRTIDNQSGVVSETHYDQSYSSSCSTSGIASCYATAGMPLYTEKRLNGELISKAINELGTVTTYAGGKFAYIKDSYEDSYVFGSDGLSTRVGSTHTSSSYDKYGNVTEQVVTQTNLSDAMELKTTTTNDYGSDATMLRMGRLLFTTVTKERTGASAISRSTSFTYNQDLMLESSVTSPDASAGDYIPPDGGEITPPDGGVITPPDDDCNPLKGDICLPPPEDPYASFSLMFTSSVSSQATIAGASARLKTVYGYDKYGNKTSVSVTGYSTNTGTPQTRVSKTVYDSRGRFVDYVANALNEKVTYKYNDLSASSASGKQTSITQIDANGLVTKTKYDALGRAYYVDHPDSKVTTTTQSLCINCKTGSYYKITTQMSGAPNKEVYFDRWGREVANSVEGFDGAWNTVVLTYDEQGRQKTVSEPNSSLVTSIDYDVLGRPYLVTSPNGNDVEKRWYGSETQEINGLGQIAYSYQNAFGELVKTVDELGNTVEFEYDSYGNLLSATTVADGKSSVISNTYDDWGRKLSTNDPIKGLWQYTYNAFGELYTQKTARQHLFTFSYDVLGRKVRSYEASEGTLCWNYGSTAHASSKAVGKLMSTAKYTATSVACNTTSSASTKKTFTYNQLSLPEQTKTYINGQWYTQTQSYDSYSRPKVTTYPSGTSSFAVESVYKSNGYLYLLRNNQTKAKLKQIDDMDERNHVSKLSYGNNVISTIDYESDTGRFSSVQITHSSNPNIHYSGVTYDLIGNVKTRTSNYSSKVGSGSNFTESYAYDDLNRLERRTISYQDTLGALPGSFKSTQTYTLDGWGNFKYKSGAGYYKYDAVKVHKLLGVYSDSSFTHALYSFSYDENGNVKSDGSRSFTYGSYDKATQISQGSNSSTMYYGVDRELYFKTDSRVEQGKSTTYQTTYLGNYEKVVRSGGTGALTEHKYYVADDVIVTHRSNGSQSSYYLHKDHQGSVVAVTDQNGKVVSQAIYDPYGKRHSIYVDSLMANFTVPEPTERGYTGHKELKGLDIIHMGGRIYDPTLGRFMQADPFIQAPKNSQNYNRYSYVLNNPMSYTDPSGYFFDKIFKEFGRFIEKYGRVILAAIITYATYGAATAWGLGSAAAGAVAGAAGGYVATGTLRGTFYGALSGAVFGAIGAEFNAKSGFWETNGYGHIGSHAVAGGIMSELQGGSFGHGFLSAGLTKATNVNGIVGTTQGVGWDAARVVVAATIGGAVSKVTGGKFGNGAITAGFAQMLNGNQQAKREELSNSPSWENVKKSWRNLKREMSRYGEAIAVGVGIDFEMWDIGFSGGVGYARFDLDGNPLTIEKSSFYYYYSKEQSGLDIGAQVEYVAAPNPDTFYGESFEVGGSTGFIDLSVANPAPYDVMTAPSDHIYSIAAGPGLGAHTATIVTKPIIEW